MPLTDGLQYIRKRLGVFARWLPFASRFKSVGAALRRMTAGSSKSWVPTSPGVVRPRSDIPAIGYRARGQAVHTQDRAKVVAFYLPQFHPIPENDAWWGPGFTEWTNVTRAVPQFEGHHQPHLPGELGFYDLRLPEIMLRQTELARQYGVSAFCFYYYWFNGKRILDYPVNHYLRSADLTLPFCLCWANEPWSRRWDGREEEILLPQQHGVQDDLDFIAAAAEFLRDPRYLRIDGRPILLVYRAELLPDPRKTAERWRNYCRQSGIGEIRLACVESFERTDPRHYGFDSAVEFPPNLTMASAISQPTVLINPDHAGEVLDWRKMAAQFRNRSRPSYPLFRGVNVSWDNEPRRPSRGRSFIHSSPRRYEDWLRQAIDESVTNAASIDERLVFVNAWNEWAEGAHLEPDTRLGYAWLEATRRAQSPSKRSDRPCVVLHAFHTDLLKSMLAQLLACGSECRLILTTTPEKETAVRKILAEAGSNAEIQTFENRGRDILPFLHVADQLLDEGEDVVLKIHTKRSPHIKDGDAWRDGMLQQLLDAARTSATLDAFRAHPDLGIVGPEEHLLDSARFLGDNEANMSYLLRRMGLEGKQLDQTVFFAGSMFWIRLAGLRPLLDTHLDRNDFEAECGQVDGTLAHAIERLIPSVAHVSGYYSATCADPEIPAYPARTRDYRFAQ